MCGNGAPGRIRTCDPRLRRPLLYPTELRAHFLLLQEMVGETGFEPATPCTQNKCATKLRYSPTSSKNPCRTRPDNGGEYYLLACRASNTFLPLCTDCWFLNQSPWNSLVNPYKQQRKRGKIALFFSSVIRCL